MANNILRKCLLGALVFAAVLAICHVALRLANPRYPESADQSGRRYPWQSAFRNPNIETYRQHYQAIAAGEPAARSVWNVHLRDGEIAYLKAPCEPDDLDGLFFLHLLPSAAGAVPRQRGPDGFVSRYRTFVEQRFAVMFDDKCLMKEPLPSWRIATLVTGQKDHESNRVFWETTLHLDATRFANAYRLARGGQPAARAVFDLHRHDQTLIYLREPCAETDVQARFFLHVVPRREDGGEPTAGREFDNLDFDFARHGLLAEGRCVALRRLPDYDISRIRTGQFVPVWGPVWEVEF